jgi:hypothetical protein
VRRLSRVLSRPELHLLLGAIFSGAFIWPLMVYERASTVFYCLFGTWAAAIIVLFVISRGSDQGEDESLKDVQSPDASDV